MSKNENIVIHMGASTFTADVRHKDKVVRFDIRSMDHKAEHEFRRELVKQFRNASQ